MAECTVKSSNPAMSAFQSSLKVLQDASPVVAGALVKELSDQRNSLKLIASENHCSLAVQLAMGNWLTDKYSEGYPGHRFYAGCENVDVIEQEAVDLAKKLFSAEHAYVQPHSGCDANLVAFWSILVQKVQSKEVERLGKKNINDLSEAEYERVRELLVNQKIMGMSLSAGGHLTHGYRHNISAKMFQSHSYGVDPKTGLIDYSALRKQALEVKPLILIAGYSAYSRLIDFAKMKEIAEEVGATLMVDMAHFAGLVAGKVLKGNFDPIPFADIVTSTTHKTLRGPRGGIVLCKNAFKEVVDKGCPIVLGGPLPHVIAAKAIAFKEALTEDFRTYAKQVVKNSQALANAFMEKGAQIVTNGTDNHLFVVDVAKTFELTGRQAETVLHEAAINVNRNTVVEDQNGPWYTSGIRLGTPALTTRGMKEGEMKEIASIIYDLLKGTKSAIDPKTNSPSRAKTEVEPQEMQRAKRRVEDLLKNFPLYPEIGGL